MPSPFPGMDPYLENPGVWPGFHGQALAAMVAQLVPQVTPAYVVQLDEQLYVHEVTDEASKRRLAGRADVSVSERLSGPRPGGDATGIAVIAAPAEVELPAVDVERIRYITIRDRTRREVVTVIELLSPANKRPGPDRQQYLDKRNQVQAGGSNLVEIDLVRKGPPMPAAANRRACDYSVLVSRAEHWPRAEFWPIGLRQRLPEIPIPLRPGDPDVRLDLQKVVDQVYDAGGFAFLLDADATEPPLPGPDAHWTRSLHETRTVPTPPDPPPERAGD